MIRLKKSPKPEYLARNASEWARVLLEKLAVNQVPSPTEKSRYRHPDIHAELISETHGKCAYCESRLLHIHHGDVEHIYPKSLAPAKTFEWKNLTLACEICNQNKSDKDPLMEHMIDPYEDDPENYFLFVGGLIFGKGIPGVSTVEILRLHRAELVEIRQTQVEKIMSIYAQIFQEEL